MNSSSNTVEQIKEKVDIVSVAEKYITLKKAGKNFVGLCPFHSEKTPSFNISPDIQIFKCFGCGKSGDVITFIQEIEKVDFKDAIEKLAKDAGIEIPKDSRPEPFKLFYDLNNLASEIYIRLLKATPIPLKYMTERGYTNEDIEKFKIGYAPRDGILLRKVKERYKLNNNQLLQSGLFIEKNGQIIDKFRDRVVFPITSATGKIVGFTGRVLPGNDYGPKYLHTPETPIFHKSNTVYGLYQAKRDIRINDLCIMCEGQTDVVTAHRVGISNIVAPLGTSLTQGQLEVVSQFTKNILFIFDSDFAGQKALERAFKIAEQVDMNSYATNTKPYKDMDEMIQKDTEVLKHRVKDKVDTFTYLVSEYMSNNSTEGMENKIKLKKFISNLLNSVTNQDRKQYYNEQINKIFPQYISETTVSNTTDKVTEQEVSAKDRELTFEETYLKCLLETDPLSIPKHHSITIFKNPKVKLILEKIDAEGPIVTKWLHKKLEMASQQYFEDISLSKALVNSDELDRIYKRIEVKYLQAELGELRSKLALAESTRDKESVETIFNKINEIMAKLKELR